MGNKNLDPNMSTITFFLIRIYSMKNNKKEIKNMHESSLERI